MRKGHKAKAWLAGGLLLGFAGWSQAAQTPTVAQMLTFKPIQRGVDCAIPAAAEHEQCKVELAKGQGKASGWVLKDPKGAMLRKFYDNNGDNYPDQWSYYKNGLEVYRELDTNFNGKADKYCWLNTAGMKIGLDRREDGTIDSWAAISPEELSQEVLKALIARDYRPMSALFVNEEDLKALGAPPAEVNRIKKIQEGAEAKFKQTVAKLANLGESTHWLRLETGAPSRLPTDHTGMKQDVLMHYRGILMCETAGKHDWVMLGEMVLVGDAWKLIDAPGLADHGVPQPVANAGTAPETVSGINPAIKDLVDQLIKLDEKAPKLGTVQADPAVVAHNLERADLLEKILAKLAEAKAPDAERTSWQKQLADSLSTAAQASAAADKRALERLAKFAVQIGKEAAGSDTAAYVVFRELSADYNLKIHAATTGDAMMAVQRDWLVRLAKFVASYKTGDDRPDALWQMGTINELQAVGNEQKAKEAEAKKCYQQLVAEHPKAPQALKAAGALRRLDLEGKPWELTAPAVGLGGRALASLDVLKAKTVIVYYWSTECSTVAADFARLKQLLEANNAKGLELVAINLDEADKQTEVDAFVRKQLLPGYQLFAGGGTDSPLATHYGLIVFPHLFLVGSDGKVINRTVQVGMLEEELKKVLK